MKTIKHTYAAAILLLIFWSMTGSTVMAQCGDSIDLGTWVQEGIPANGNWVVTGGGNAVNQTINGDPTFYVSPDSFINVIITGDIQVTTTGDDDWVGFVFGYLDPDTNAPANYDFYLFDWKQANQNFNGFLGNEGFSLTRINGPVVNFPEAFSSNAGPFANLMGSQYGPNEGWNDLQVYSFALTYTNTRTVISIDGDTIFDLFGCFPPGRFGFYNYSQSDVQYSNFSYRVAAAFEVLTPDVCLGDTARFIALSDSCENAAGIPVNNTIVSWFWDFGDGNTSNDTNANHYYQNPGTYEVSLVVTDYLGCKDTAISEVDVFNVSTDLGNDTAICIGDTITLDADTNASDYLWSTGAVSQTIQVTAAGTYTVTVTGGGGCTDTDTVVISNLALPIVDIGNDTSICNNDTIVLYAGNAGASFLWNDGSVQDSLAVHDSGTYVVQVTYPSGCSNTDTAIVTNLAQPVVTPPNPSLCYGDTVNISAAGANTYTWFPAFGLSSTTGGVVQTFTLVDTTYSVIGIDTNGCTDTSVFQVDVLDLPTVSISGGDSICNGDSIALALTLTGLGPWDVTYTLNGDTFYRNGIVNAADTFFASDSGMYVPIAVSDAQCSNTGMDSTYVYLRTLPTISFQSLDDSICFGDTIAISAQGANSYIWSPSTGLDDSLASTVNANPTASQSYLVSGTDQFGCSDTASFYLEVLPLPTLTTAASENPICSLDTLILESTGAQSYFWTESLNGDTIIGDSITQIPTSTVTYTVHGTDIYGCMDTSSILIAVDTLPVVSISPDDTAFCINDSTSLLASGANNYAWSPALGLNMTTGASVIASPTDTMQYMVVGTDLNGCIGRDTATVNIWSLPIVTISAAETEICIYDSIELQAQGATSYNWSPTYNILNTAGATTIIHPEIDTSYAVVGTDNNGCSSSDTFDLIVHPLPNITLNAPNDSICRFDTTMLTAGGAVSYQWTNTPGLSAYDQAMVDAYPISSSLYEVFGTDVNGCVNSNDTTIKVLTLPNIIATPANGAICFGESQTITLPSTYSFTWSPLTNLQFTTNNNSVAIANPGDTTTYSIFAIDSLGCENDTTYTLAVTPLPVISTSIDDEFICPRKPTTLHVTGNYNFQWGPNIYITNANTANPTVAPQSTQEYIVTATGPGNCKQYDTITAKVFPTGPYSAGNDQVICSGDSVQFQASGGLSYEWGPSLGLSDTTISNPYCSSTANRFYYVTITDGNGCTAQRSVFITVHDLPVAKAGKNDTICIGESVTIGGQPTGPSGSSFQWHPPAGLQSTVVANPLADPVTSTTYTVLVTDLNGCQKESKTRVVVNPLPELELLEKPKYICDGDTGRIRVTPGLASYEWTPAQRLATPGSSSTLAYPRDSTTYSVIGIDEHGCVSTLSFDLAAPRKPHVNIRQNAEMCFGDTVRMNATADNGEIVWSPKEIFDVSDTIVPLTFAENVTDVRLTVTDSLGCDNYDEALVFVHQLPLADAGEDLDNCEMSTIYLGGAVPTTEENEWVWYPGEKLNNPLALNPKVLSIDVDTFVLEVRSPEGCMNRDTVVANSDCYRHLYIPNTFSPDGDLINDIFLAKGRNIYEVHMEIYDRFGHMIFKSNSIDFGWDGRYMDSGNDAPIGTYFWQMTFKTESGRQLSDEGLVNLVR